MTWIFQLFCAGENVIKEQPIFDNPSKMATLNGMGNGHHACRLDLAAPSTLVRAGDLNLIIGIYRYREFLTYSFKRYHVYLNLSLFNTSPCRLLGEPLA